MENQLVLSACIAELPALRYTPAGVAALDVRLQHESEQLEAGSPRKVQRQLKAVAFGALAEKLARQSPEAAGGFKAFWPRRATAKRVVLHIQDMQQN